MAKITYTNKNKAGTGDALLWKDVDANEVKTSVNAIYDTTLTITGTTNQITATGGVQNLESNRLWIISLPTNICTGIISATTCFVGSGAGLTGTASSLTAIPASHTHGDISNTGTITSTAITPTSGDYILLSDTTASGSIKRGIVLGSSTTTFLANNGTWLTPIVRPTSEVTLINSIVGGSFEVDSNNDGFADGWFKSSTTDAELNTDAVFGSYSQKIIAKGSSTTNRINPTTYTSPIKNSDVMYVSLWIKCSSEGISCDMSDTHTFTTTTEWKRHSFIQDRGRLTSGIFLILRQLFQMNTFYMTDF